MSALGHPLPPAHAHGYRLWKRAGAITRLDDGGWPTHAHSIVAFASNRPGGPGHPLMEIFEVFGPDSLRQKKCTLFYPERTNYEIQTLIASLLNVRSEKELERRFGTERACQETLANLRWPGGFLCQRCSGRSSAYLSARRIWYCQTCGHQTSLIAGTVFAHTKKPLPLWFKALWVFLHAPRQGCGKEGAPAPIGPMSVQYFQERLSLTRYETAWIWMQKLRAWVASLGLDGPMSPQFRAAIQRAMKAAGTRGRRAWGSHKSEKMERKWHQIALHLLQKAAREPRRHPVWRPISDWIQSVQRPPVSRKHFGRWIAEGLMRCWLDTGTDLPDMHMEFLGSIPNWRLISRVRPTAQLQPSLSGSAG